MRFTIPSICLALIVSAFLAFAIIVNAQTNDDEETPATESESSESSEIDPVTISTTSGSLQTGTPVPEQVGDWWIICDDGGGVEENRRCIMQQRIYTAEGAQAALAEVFKIEGDPLIKAGMSILTPLGTNLRQGLRLVVDEGRPEKQYQFSFCLSDGCLVEAAIFGSEIETMKEGEVLHMTLNAYNSDESLKYEISLQGFTSAYDQL